VLWWLTAHVPRGDESHRDSLRHVGRDTGSGTTAHDPQVKVFISNKACTAWAAFVKVGCVYTLLQNQVPMIDAGPY
jgi:hypothetical protein